MGHATPDSKKEFPGTRPPFARIPATADSRCQRQARRCSPPPCTVCPAITTAVPVARRDAGFTTPRLPAFEERIERYRAGINPATTDARSSRGFFFSSFRILWVSAFAGMTERVGHNPTILLFHYSTTPPSRYRGPSPGSPAQGSDRAA